MQEVIEDAEQRAHEAEREAMRHETHPTASRPRESDRFAVHTKH